jgi:hypothetical protein
MSLWMWSSASRCRPRNLGNIWLDVVHRSPEPFTDPDVLAGIPFDRKRIRSCGCRRRPDVLARNRSPFPPEVSLPLAWRISLSSGTYWPAFAWRCPAQDDPLRSLVLLQKRTFRALILAFSSFPRGFQTLCLAPTRYRFCSASFTLAFILLHVEPGAA